MTGSKRQLNVLLKLTDSFTGPLRKATQNTKSFDKELKYSTRQVQLFGKKTTQSLKKIGDVLKVGFSGITAYLGTVGIAGIVDAAADIQAMEAQFEQVFGGMKGVAEEKLQAVANTTGIVENRLKNSFSQIAAFAKTTGMDTSSALALSERATIAVADSAAFYDRELEDVTESLRSFLKGNYENDAALGLSCTETTRNAAANKLYGKSFKDLSEEQKQLTLMQMVEDANKASGALGQAARESDTWTNQIGNLKQAWKDIQSVIGAAFLPEVVNGVKAVSDKLTENKDTVAVYAQSIKDFLSGLYNAAKPFLSFFLNNLGTVLPVLLGLGAGLKVFNVFLGLGTKVASLTKSVKVVTSAFKFLNLAMKANPVGMIITAVFLLIGLFVSLYNNSETFRNGVNKIISVFRNLKNVAVNVFNGIKTKFENVKNSLVNALNVIKQKFIGVFDKIKNKFTGFAETVKNGISKIPGFSKLFESSAGTNIGHNATGTAYWRGGLTHINEHGGEIIDLPNGTRIIPHDVALKQNSGNQIVINLTVQGNVLGNNDFMESMGNYLAAKLMQAVANC